MSKVSIRFFDDKEVRAVWDDNGAKWWFSVIDVIMVLGDCRAFKKHFQVSPSQYRKARNVKS